LFNKKNAYDWLKGEGIVNFLTTSYLRGMTIRNSFVIVDEMQNLNFHELDSVITRIGEGSRLILCGDYNQSDFEYDDDRRGIKRFREIISRMPSFVDIEFTEQDIVRSGLVKEYIMAKNRVAEKK